jgi:hypothetical protein
VLGLLVCRASIAVAASSSVADDASRMSGQSFALLATLNAQSGGGSSNPLLGPVATFASDTETLKQALATTDAPAQARAVNALIADSRTIDEGLKANPNALKPEDWRPIRDQLAHIARAVAQATAGKIPPAPPANSGIVRAERTPTGAPAAPSAATPASASPPPALAAALPPASSTESGPVVKIASRTFDGQVVHIKGYIEGKGLKSAGIYTNGQPLRTFAVDQVPGRQKIDLDIGVASPPPDAVLRVTDASGRSAEAPVLETMAALPALPSTAAVTGASHEGGADVYPENPAGAGASPDTTGASDEDESPSTDIPSHGTPTGPVLPSPSRRHTLGGQLANVQINVLGVTQTATSPTTYEVVGQIDGRGVTRAGVYVDGRLMTTIPIVDGENFTNFDQRFVMSGSAATIRAYGAGSQFVESSIDLTGQVASAQPLPGGPMIYATRPSAPGIGVLIGSLRPAGGNLYNVSGTISGANIASAGLYQNGVLAQPIQLGGLGGIITGGGGLGSMLGSLIPGTSRSVNFNLRFNPSAGYASIRAYDRTGNYTEQPVMAGGVNPYGVPGTYGGPNPYAAPVNPYAAPVNPYGVPNRAVNPYGMSTNPYGGMINPYMFGGSSGAPSRPLW